MTNLFGSGRMRRTWPAALPLLVVLPMLVFAAPAAADEAARNREALQGLDSAIRQAGTPAERQGLIEARAQLAQCARSGRSGCVEEVAQQIRGGGVRHEEPPPPPPAPAPEPVALPPAGIVCPPGAPTPRPGGYVCFTDFTDSGSCTHIFRYNSDNARQLYGERFERPEPVARCPQEVLDLRRGTSTPPPTLPAPDRSTMVRDLMNRSVLAFVFPEATLADVTDYRPPVAVASAPTVRVQAPVTPAPSAPYAPAPSVPLPTMPSMPSVRVGDVLSGAGEVLGAAVGIGVAVLGFIAGSRGASVPSVTVPRVSVPRPSYQYPQGRDYYPRSTITGTTR